VTSVSVIGIGRPVTGNAMEGAEKERDVDEAGCADLRDEVVSGITSACVFYLVVVGKIL